MRKKKFAAQAYLLSFSILVSTSSAWAESFTTAPPVAVLTTQQMQNFGIDFPDSPIDAIKKGGGKFYTFGAGGSFGGIGPGINVVPPGTYRFFGTATKIAPAQMNGSYPAFSLTRGRLQPSPDGSDFDRDYAGRGEVHAETIDGRAGLVHVYHGEFWKNYPDGNQFYSAAGIATSFNDGQSFTKIGEFISPHLSRADFFASLTDPTTTAGVSADGYLVEADVNGNPLAPHSGESYLYDFFTDRESVNSRPGFTIARIKKSDFLEALSMKKVPLIKKYYQPGGGFTEPGLGGNSTLILTQGTDFLAQPQVRYNPFLHKFILIYQTNQNKVQVRTSNNLLDWSQSQPTTLIDSSNSGALKTFYPSGVGLNANTEFLGQKFLLYFQQRYSARQSKPNLYCAEITITP